MKHGTSRFALLIGILTGLVGSGGFAPVSAIDLSRLPLPAPHVKSTTGATTRQGLKPAAAAGATAARGFAGKKAAAVPATTPTRDLLQAASPGVARFAAIARHGLEARSDLNFLAGDQAVHQLATLMEANGPGLQLDWRPESGTPMILQGSNLLPYAVPSAGDPTTVARAFLSQYGALLRLDDPENEMAPFRVERSSEGFQAVRFQQKYRGLTVWGRDTIVRLDPAGHVTGFGGHYLATPKFVATTARVGWADAQRTLLRELAMRDKREALLDEKHGAAVGLHPQGAATEPPALGYYPAPNGLRLAWRAVVSDGLDYRREAFVDAVTGEFLHDVSLVMNEGVTGHGTDLSNTTREVQAFKVNSDFFLINTTKPMFNPAGPLPNEGKGVIWLINAQNGDGNQLIHVTTTNKENWGNGNRNAISAAFWANIVFDYFQARHNRNSIDDKGMNLQLVTNFKTNYNNAFWNGTFMIFGNGDGNQFSDLAGSLDVTGHEMSHGVTEHTANLVYELQPGALNEHFSDVMGVAVDFFANPGTANFLVGEDVTTPGTPGDGLRNMQDPHNAASPQPASMAEFNNLPNNDDNDHGGVHVNSGIPNRAFFLASTAAGMTVAKSERIWYRCLSQYLVRNSQFVDFRIGLTKAAEDLFGAGSAEQTAVVNALDTVGIPQPGGGGGGGTPPPPPLPDNNGTDFVAAVDSNTGVVFRTHPNGVLDFQQVTAGAVGPGGRPSFSDDGQIMAWVGDDNNVYAARSDGANEIRLTEDANWWSVALNNTGTLLAATSRFEDGTIFVFDLDNAANDKSYVLENQTSSEGATGDLVIFADVLEFAAGTNFLLYDAKNRTTLNGTTRDYWDINLLRLDNGNTLRVFQPLPLDESIGNPTFAQNSDNKMAFDHVKADGNIEVLAVDFQSGNAGLVTNNFTSDGRPTFSGDDHEILYHYRDGVNVDTIFRVTLASDGITGTGDDAVWATEGFWPVWYTIGTARTPVTLVSFTGAWLDAAVQLDWRVADAAGTVGYHVERQVTEGAGFERRTTEIIPAGEGAEGAYRFEEAAPVEAGSAVYRVMAVERNGSVRELGRLAVDRQGGGRAELRPVLLPASPNPFVGNTQVRFVIPERLAGVTGSVTVHDLNGRLVARLLDDARLEAGERALAWDGTNGSGVRLAAGAYFVKLNAGGTSLSQKVILAR